MCHLLNSHAYPALIDHCCIECVKQDDQRVHKYPVADIERLLFLNNPVLWIKVLSDQISVKNMVAEIVNNH